MNTSKNFFGLSVLVVTNVAMQFLFQWYIIRAFGVGIESDAFFSSMALPQFVLLVLSGSLSIVLIPILTTFTEKQFYSAAWTYFISTAIFFGVLALILYFSANWWVSKLYPGFNGEGLQLSITLSKIQLISMVLSATLSVLWAVHSAKENFYLIESTSIIANIFSFVFLILVVKYFDIYTASYVFVLRGFLQIIFLISILGKYNKVEFKAELFYGTWVKMKPLILGNLYYKTDALVDKYLTSSSISGHLTLLNIAQQLYAAGNSILTKIIVNTMVPSMARAHIAKDYKLFNSIYKKRLWTAIMISVLTFIIFVLVGKPMLRILFNFQKFTESSVSELWWLMILLFGYWIGGLLGAVTSSTFYAKGNTKQPTIIGVVTYSVYIPAKIFCYFKFGIKGLALSITVYYLMSFLIQYIVLLKGDKKFIL